MSFYCIDDATDAAGVPQDVGVTALSGVIDYYACPTLKHHLKEQIDAGRKWLVVNLSDVEFIDSTTIGVLVGTTAHMKDSGPGSGGLLIVCPGENESVHRILDVARVESVVDVYPSVAEALSTLAPAA
jgi:anti-sigma B factor antagonist